MPKTATRIIISVLFLTTAYVILRYHIFKGVEWSHFPLFILNKILAFAGFMMLVLSFGLEPVYRKKGPEWFSIRKFLGRTGLMLIVLHIFMSLLLFRPEVYDKFFDPGGTLNAVGEWSMLLGSLGIAAYIVMHNSFANAEEGNGFQNFIRSPVFGLLALVLSVLHITIVGFSGWLTPGDWYGGMPSVSFLSAVFFLVALLVFLGGQLKSTETNKK